LGYESGTFVRVDKELELKEVYTITFGRLHIIINTQMNFGPEEVMYLQVVDGIKPKQK